MADSDGPAGIGWDDAVTGCAGRFFFVFFVVRGGSKLHQWHNVMIKRIQGKIQDWFWVARQQLLTRNCFDEQQSCTFQDLGIHKTVSLINKHIINFFFVNF